MRIRADGEQALLAALILFVGVVSLLPMLRLLCEGVAPGGTPGLAVAREVLAMPVTWGAARRTLETALAGTALSLLLGSAFALLVALTDIRAKGPLVFCFLLPMMIPPQITALSWLQVAGPGSPLLNTLGLAPPPGSPHPLHGRDGIVLLLGIQHAPLVFLALRAGLRGLPRELIEAARAAGAGHLQVLTGVVLPLMTPPLVAGAALAFVSAVGNFGIPALLGFPAGYTVLPTLIYRRLASYGPSVIAEVAVLSVMVAAIALAGFALQAWMLRRRDYRTVGAPSRALAYRLGRWRLPAEAAAWSVIALILVLPLSGLAATSLVSAYGVPLGPGTATLANYAEVMFRQAATIRAFRNSFLLAGGAALILVVASVPLAYFVVWRQSRVLAVLNAAAELPYALPGVVLAIACILVFIQPLPVLGVSVYGTGWIILLAYLGRFLALALRPAISGLMQTDRAMEEAARMCGARFGRRLVTIVLPLLAPTAAAGGILVFLTAMNELTVSALLWSAGNETLGVIVFNLDDGGSAPLAAAVSTLSVGVILVLMLAAAALAPRLPQGVVPWSA
ncbi:MAG: iron ABC transporter permease [Thalassobaculales bacterium]